MEDSNNELLHAFDHWHFDAGTGDIWDESTKERLGPKVARLLTYFLTHQDTLISRDELMSEVWDDRVVSDDAVNRCISILRQKLSPNDKHAYIETVVRRGFISHFPPPLGDAAPAADGRQEARPWLGAALGAAAALLVVAGLYLFGGSPPEPGSTRGGVPMVAVLPFASAGFDDDGEFFANGIHDDLLTQLAQFQSMRVISRTSVTEYRDTDRNIKEIGRELGADAILEGSVQRVGDEIRINVQLIDARTDAHLWAQNYDRALSPSSIFDVQAEIARAISAAMQATLTRMDAESLDILPTDNMAAYRAYHEAMEMRTSQTIDTPAYIAALEFAVALDPDFVRAWAELAGSLSYQNLGNRDPDSIRRLEDMLERMRALAPKSSEYLIAQAYYTYYILRDNDRAYDLLSRARSARPSDLQVLELQSWIQRRQGDIDGWIETLRQAQAIDPRTAHWTERLATVLILAHRYEEASEVIDNAPVDSFKLALWRSTLRVREHGEPARLLDDLSDIEQSYGEEATPEQLWEAQIVARDFTAAVALLNSIHEAERPADVWAYTGIPNLELSCIITDHFIPDRTCSGPGIPELRLRLEPDGDSSAESFAANIYLKMAFVAAAQGDVDETERYVETWLREAAQDLAELIGHRHYGCRALGMARAVRAATECLRSAFVEPSAAMPFIEPLLPYYDSMRDDPRFAVVLDNRQAAVEKAK